MASHNSRSMAAGSTFPGPELTSERHVQAAHQFPHPAATSRSSWVTGQNADHVGASQIPGLRDVCGTNFIVVTSIELECPGSMSSRAEDVQDLRRFRQWMKECPTGRGEGSPGGFTSRSLPRVAGLLIRPLRSPGIVPDHLGPLGSVHERLRDFDRGSWPRVVWTVAFEDRQRGLRTGHCKARDRPQLSHAELGRQRHTSEPYR